jgi:hypothetical protein
VDGCVCDRMGDARAPRDRQCGSRATCRRGDGAGVLGGPRWCVVGVAARTSLLRALPCQAGRCATLSRLSGRSGCAACRAVRRPTAQARRYSDLLRTREGCAGVVTLRRQQRGGPPGARVPQPVRVAGLPARVCGARVRACAGGVGAQPRPQLPAARRDPRGVRRGAPRGCAAVCVPRAASCGGRKGAFGWGPVSGAGARGWPAWGSLRVVSDATCALRVGGATGRGCWVCELRWPPLRVGSRGGVWWELSPARRCCWRWRVSPAAASLCPAWVGAAGAPRAVRCVARQRRLVATHIDCERGRSVLAW